MVEPAHIALEHLAQVADAVFQQRDAVDAHAPGEALIDIGIDAAIPQHVRMPHAAAENLQPVFAFAETNYVLAAATLDINFHRRFGEREERRTESHIDVIDFEERLAEFRQNPSQMTKVRALVDDEALDLMKHRRVSLVGIATIGAARAD